MNSSEIRSLFTRFFEERGHRRMPSSSLIPPPEEKTLLFTTAGMLQMKPFFMGLVQPPSARLMSIQKCFRTNDIEEVGDNRHCTFFEMLGNFSVGDYFKPEIIPWAWELLTAAQPRGLGLIADRLWVTIFEEDDEAFELWRGVGIPAERIIRNPEKDAKGSQLNYWFMGRVGPCGPNTEISYDFGEYEGWEPHDCDPNCEVPGCRRFIELWNLVFMTLYQDEDGSRRPLPFKNVDTGAGFERWPMPVLWQQQVDWQGNPKRWTQPPTIYDTDLFQPILQRVGELAGLSYGEDEERDRAMRIIAEHSRAATFLLGDGVRPSNEGRGYVLRRLIRRGMYFGWGATTDLDLVAETVIEQMSGEYPHLVENRESILRLLVEEERRFHETMERAGAELDEEIKATAAKGAKTLSGERAFYFDATLGFPVELTREVAGRAGLEIDEAVFEAEMEKHRAVSRAASRFEGDAERIQTYIELGLEPTEFLGYETTRVFANVRAIVVDGNRAAGRSATAARSSGRRGASRSRTRRPSARVG